MEISAELSELQKQWLIEENRKLEDDKKRRYLHFDPRIYKLTEQQTGAIFNLDRVAKRPFYPFVRDDKEQRRHKREDGKKVIKIKSRPISYAAHGDALIYSFYTWLLSQSYEQVVKAKGIGQNVLAYRKTGKSTLNFAGEVFALISEKKDCTAVCFDVKGFFDNLDHDILKAQWQNVLGQERLPNDHFAIYKSITNFSYVQKKDLIRELALDRKQLGTIQRYCSPEDFHKKVRGGRLIKVNTDKGIPQGAPISAVLSNIYMLDFDVAVAQYITNLGGLYRRYCDDIIVVVPSTERANAQNFVMAKINDLKLEISVDKTEVVEFKDNELVIDAKDARGLKRLQYLGLEFDGKNIYLRHRGLAAFQRRAARGIRGALAWAEREKKPVPKRRLYEKYSIYSQQNYLIYAKRAAEELNSSTIAHQIRDHKVMKFLKGRLKKEA